MAHSGNHEVWKGMAAGLVGGLVASWTMNQFQALLSKLAKSRQQAAQPQQQLSPSDMDKPATLKMAEKLAHAVLHRELRSDEEKIAEPLVHYVYGTAWGGIYGALAQTEPITAKAVGLPFGAALWLAGDEIAVPAMGLSKGPTEYPLSSHLQALATHFVYGVTTDLVRRAMLKALD